MLGKPWTHRQLCLLGTMSDADLAKKLKRPLCAVRQKRWSLGIKPFGWFEIWTEENLALLGTISDHDLAHRLGVDRSGVSRKRRELEIPAFQPLRESA